MVEGLRFSNPSISLRIAGGSSVAATTDKGLQWMFQCLQQRCLSENLNWLITDKEHMGQCYESTAFLRDERYADAMMVCFNALERGQPTLLSQIDPCLYAVDQGQTALIGTIKRSESHPNLLLIKDVPTSGQGCVLKRRQTIHLAKARSSRVDRKSSQKMSRSLPNIVLNDYYQVTKKKPPDGIDGKLPDPAATSSRAAGPNVPSFNYSDNRWVNCHIFLIIFYLNFLFLVCQNQRSTSSTARTSKSTRKRPAAQAARNLNRSAASNGTNLNPRNGAKVPARTCSVWRLSREVRARCLTSSFHSAAKRSPKIWILCVTNPSTAC